jgi:KipI family sensor histidine kinase inhibitor
VSLAFRPVGDAALLVEIEPARRSEVAQAIAGLSGVVDIVAAQRSVLVSFDPAETDADGLAKLVGSALRAAVSGAYSALAPAPAVEVLVQYDGPDLDAVAHLTGLSAQEVVARHVAGDYVVAFMGFAPGFGYLDGLDPALHVPRLATPRTRVDAGAVAIAGARSCVYPRPSPGGWRVLGHTNDVLFDARAEFPSLLQAGVRVRFREA